MADIYIFRRASRPATVAILGLATSLFACLSTVEPPARTPQVSVSFPSRIYLAGEAPPFDTMTSVGPCEGLYGAPTATVSPAPAAIYGPALPPDYARIPHDCFVAVDTSAIRASAMMVDIHEVTNEQYQLCVDSGACSGPDPSRVDKSDLCQNEDDFDRCPMVDVSPVEAAEFCEWVGRRLPSGLEMTMIKQAGLPTPSPATAVPSSIPLLPSGDTIPSSCEEAVLANGSCSRPRAVYADDGSFGAAAGDRVSIDASKGSGEIHDLVGNVSELLADLYPNNRGNASGFPWFCTARAPSTSSTAYSPYCPNGSACVWGSYAPEGMAYGVYPVCITASPITGYQPVIHGSSYFEELRAAGEPTDGERTLEASEAAGIFAYRELSGVAPTEVSGSQLGKRLGFRCVGQRESPVEFDDALELVRGGTLP